MEEIHEVTATLSHNQVEDCQPEQDFRQLAISALELLPEFAVQMDEALAEVVDMLRVQQEQEAMARFSALTNDLRWMSLVCDSLDAVLGLDLDGFSNNDSSAQVRRERFLHLCCEIMDSLETGDYILFADLLEYELREEISFWQDLAPTLIFEAKRPCH